MAGKKNTIKKVPKILPHKHSGRFAHHRHTSYEALFALLVIAALFVSTLSNTLVSAQSAPPVEDSYQTHAIVAETAPSSAPEITSIRDGQNFTSADPIQVGGRCASGMIIKIFKNQVLSGSTLCRNNAFSIQSDLFVGANSIVARAHNVSNKAGPDSTPINVRLVLDGRGTANDPVNPFGGPAGQLYISTEQSHVGVNPGDPITWPISVNGGRAPFAINISWGDRTTELVSRSTDGTFEVKHRYKEPGTYQVVVDATDQLGNKAKLELVAIAGMPQATAGSQQKSGPTANGLVKPSLLILGALILLVVAFWLGEKREEYIMKKRLTLA